MGLIKESKRDDLLVPYFEKIRSMGVNIQFGEFKSAILQKLSTEAGMHNLSLRSNYYIAGAAKYYFNGDLTVDGNVALLSRQYWAGDRNVPDNWNEEVCHSLDLIILYLRNSYIDSVGSTMEQPEDFGNLPIKKLLKKYGGKVKKALNIQEPKGDGIDRSDVVGKGYTFEIMYSQADCRKYERPTAPGSWCITYGQCHYDSYVRRLNIHYVIFRQNGWEGIPRPSDPRKEPGFTKRKPHDKYGNSLIALLQSNTSPEPVFITSRWNHGYEVPCEADHAYTKEEFKKITGVTDDDLQRIYDIWKADKSKKKEKTPKTEVVNALRAFKYAQMRINSGESPESILKQRQFLFGNQEKLSKSISIVELDVNGTPWNALLDRSKIVFETISHIGIDSYLVESYNLIMLNLKPYVNMIYNVNRHKLISINNTIKFKYVPELQYDRESLKNISGSAFFAVKQTKHDNALINARTCEPLKLPNGEYWFNMAYGNAYYFGDTKCCFLTQENCPMLEIIYDLSSGEEYFFDLIAEKFVDKPTLEAQIPKLNGANSHNIVPIIKQSYCSGNKQNYYGYYVIEFVPQNEIRTYGSNNIRYTTSQYPKLLYKNGKMQYIDGAYLFSDIRFTYGFIAYTKVIDNTEYGNNSYLYDINNHKILSILGRPIAIPYYCVISIKKDSDDVVLAGRNGYSYVYNKRVGEFYHSVKNPTNRNEYLISDDDIYGKNYTYPCTYKEYYLGDEDGTENVTRDDIQNMVLESIYYITRKLSTEELINE